MLQSLIFAVDINCDLRNNTPTSLLIKARLNTLGLVLVNNYLEPNNIDISFTFYQESTGANSYIDHVLVSQLCNVRRMCAIDDARNVSDHLPVVMTFESATLFQNSVESSVTVPPGLLIVKPNNSRGYYGSNLTCPCTTSQLGCDYLASQI